MLSYRWTAVTPGSSTVPEKVSPLVCRVTLSLLSSPVSSSSARSGGSGGPGSVVSSAMESLDTSDGLPAASRKAA